MSEPGRVLVVGGTKGLGRVASAAFRARGCPVSVVSRHAPLPSEVAEGVDHISADLEMPDCAERIAKGLDAVGGGLRYVVFCQRYRGSGDPWDGEFAVSVTATKRIVEILSDRFVTGRDCAIGVVSSVYAEFVGGSQPVGYHAAKSALNGLVRYYAWQLGRKGIRVNAIMPLTYIKPESRDFYLANEPLLEVYRKFVPLGRMGTAEDSAHLLEFLCSEKAAFINGQSIFVDGGVSVVWPEELARSLSGV